MKKATFVRTVLESWRKFSGYIEAQLEPGYEAKLNEAKRSMLDKVTNAAHFIPTVNSSSTADHPSESIQSTPVRAVGKKRVKMCVSLS